MRMIVSDYDDTFYTNNEDIKKNVKCANNFMVKDLFVIATGRSYHDFLDVEKLYHINYSYLIINHGATIIKDNEVLYNKTIDNNIKNSLIKDLEIEIAVNKLACCKLNSRVPLTSNNLTKIHVRYKDQNIAKKIKDTITIKYGKYVNCYFVCRKTAIEIVNKNSTKANAIQFIAERENISNTKIYTIGDGYSDIDMLKQFQGFAMSNAISEIKEYKFKEYKNVFSLIYDIRNGKYE